MKRTAQQRSRRIEEEEEEDESPVKVSSRQAKKAKVSGQLLTPLLCYNLSPVLRTGFLSTNICAEG